MKKTVSIIGGGPSALCLAAFLDASKFDITIYEKNKTIGRKFLVAGKGGFNLTHAELPENFIKRYTPPTFLKNAFQHFDNTHLRTWLKGIGIPTFVGSSKRVFPEKGIKPIEVLNAILKVLKEKNVQLQFEYNWMGWTEQQALVFNNNLFIQSDYTIFSLGGGSWKVTGSDGTWLTHFSNKKIQTLPFQSSNCAYKINWSDFFIEQHEGKALKNISISCGEKIQKGEVVITKFGLEGNAIYALSPSIQQALKNEQKAAIFIDLKPMIAENDLQQRINNSSLQKTTEILRKEVKLSSAAISLLKASVSKATYLDTVLLTKAIKRLPIEIVAAAPVDEAISTSGGIALDEVDQNFELKRLAHHFSIGEMLDWNAPTGGYLLQACFSMGAYLAHYLNSK